jgi:hypothetical protein
MKSGKEGRGWRELFAKCRGEDECVFSPGSGLADEVGSDIPTPDAATPDRVIHRYISQQSPKTITHFVKDVEAIPSRTHN